MAVRDIESRTGGRSGLRAAVPAAGVLSAVAAFASASCCVLPLTFAVLGLGGSWMAIFDTALGYRDILMTTALVAVGAGWGLVIWRRVRVAPACDGACAVRPRQRLTLLALVTASAFIAGAWAVTEFQGDLTRWLFAIRTGA